MKKAITAALALAAALLDGDEAKRLGQPERILQVR
jgi:hypothetical protein